MIFKLKYDRAVMDTDGLTTSEAMVALAWASTCDYETGSNVKQSFETVAQKAKVSRRSVIRLTQDLVRKGWLEEVERQPYKPTVYRLSIPTSDSTSLVTDEAGLVTSETRLVTNEAPTSDTVTPNKKNTRTTDKNKDKNKTSGAASAPGLRVTVPISLESSPSSGDLPLEVPTEAVAPPLEEILRKSKDYDQALALFLDPEFMGDREPRKRALFSFWEADSRYDARVAKEALDAAVRNPGHQETEKASEAGRKNPRGTDDPSTTDTLEARW